MKHYINLDDGRVYGFAADGSQDHIKPKNLREMTDEEFELFRNPPLTQQEKIDIGRGQRDVKLIELDKVVSNPLRMSSYTSEQVDELTTYRQLLLDVPQQAGFPDDISWPQKPTFI